MNASPEVARLRSALRTRYEQWRQLTEAEGIAISTGQWTQVELLQKTKRQLRSFIDEVRRDLRAACQSYGGIAREIEQEFRSLIGELLASEARNNQTLVERRIRAITEEQRLRQAIQNLHQIRGAYALPRPAHWELYG
jgi:hypothetical protein